MILPRMDFFAFIFAIWGSVVMSTLLSSTAHVQSPSFLEQEVPTSVCSPLFLNSSCLRVQRHYPAFPSLNVLPFTLTGIFNSMICGEVFCQHQRACEEQDSSTYLLWFVIGGRNKCWMCEAAEFGGLCFSQYHLPYPDRGPHFTFCHRVGDCQPWVPDAILAIPVHSDMSYTPGSLVCSVPH